MPPGRLDNVNTRLLIPSHALPPTFLCLCIKSGPDFMSAQKLNFVTREVGVGTGVYGMGAPRQIEFGLVLSF